MNILSDPSFELDVSICDGEHKELKERLCGFTTGSTTTFASGGSESFYHARNRKVEHHIVRDKGSNMSNMLNNLSRKSLKKC